MVDRSGQPDVTRNVIEAHSTFSEDTRIEHTHDRSGEPDERDSSNAQIKTLLEEQRQTIIAEYCEKVGHHELQTTHATFDAIARRKLIEDQNTILELSGRLQELQNEVNCMNDSQDFQDAELVRSGNSHVTSRQVSFPPHPIPEGMLRHSFVSPSRREGPPSIWDTHGISGNVFENPDASSSAPYHPKNCINEIRYSKSRSIRPQWRKVKGQNKFKI